MNQSLVAPRPASWNALPALRKTMIVALIANVLAHSYLQVVILRTLIPPLAVILVLTLVVAGLCATPWRWAPLVAVIFGVVSIIPGIPPYIDSLTHPAEFAVFAQTVVSNALLLIAIVAGIAATTQRNQHVGDTQAPRWLPTFVASVAAFSLGAILVAAIPQPVQNAAVSAAALNSLPALTTANYQFEPREIKTKVGETVSLRLHNSDTAVHSFDIDALNVHVRMSGGKDTLATFTPTTAGTYTFYCAVPEHANLATGSGMVGKLIVAP